VEYPQVKHAHIVPRAYLVNFADEDKRLTMRLIGSAASRVISIRDAAVRTDFYKRARRDGTVIYDVEWSLSHLEGVAAPVLREIAERWPLDLDDRGKLAAFFGYQLVRGPRWKAWHEGNTHKILEGYRRLGLIPADPEGKLSEAEIIAGAKQELLTDTERLTRMLSLAPKAASIVGSMHWSLVEFNSLIVATSDHPVVAWPLAERSRRPQPTPFEVGLLETLEVRAPVSSRHAIVMTWLDEPDGPIVRGARSHAANINAFTAAQAERQWFHLPGVSPPLATGLPLPISPELVRPYNQAAARRSWRRSEITRRIQPKLGNKSLSRASRSSGSTDAADAYSVRGAAWTLLCSSAHLRNSSSPVLRSRWYSRAGSSSCRQLIRGKVTVQA